MLVASRNLRGAGLGGGGHNITHIQTWCVRTGKYPRGALKSYFLNTIQTATDQIGDSDSTDSATGLRSQLYAA